MRKLLNVLLACAISAGALGAAALPAAAQVYGGAYVQFGPPAPIYEAAPVSPGPNYYWIPGYYRWNGYRYVWNRGYYGYRPYAGAVWHAGHWAQGPYGWQWRPGHWGRPY